METTLFKSFPQETISTSPSGLGFYINYLNTLEGIKTRIKNLHWAAKKLPVNEHKGAHVYLDDFLDVVSSFQDTVAECSQGILGHMSQNEIQGITCNVNSPSELIKYLIDKTIMFYEAIPKEVIHVGIKSETETFIGNLTKYKYLFELTE